MTGAVRSALQGTARLLGGNLGARHLPSQLRLEKRRIHPGAACSEGKSLTEEGEGRGERLVGLGVRTEPRLGPAWVSHAHPGTQNGGGGIGRGGRGRGSKTWLPGPSEQELMPPPSRAITG